MGHCEHETQIAEVEGLPSIKVEKVATNNLDRVIDRNYRPVEEARRSDT